MDIAHVFKPYEQAVEISLQMPEDWNYILWDVEEESPDWGYSVKVQEEKEKLARYEQMMAQVEERLNQMK